MVSDVVKADRRAIVGDMLRTDLVTTVEQGPPGIIRVGIGSRFDTHDAREYYFDQLASVYSAWTVEGHPLTVELWSANGKIGEFADRAFLIGPENSTPLDCPESAATGLCATTSRPRVNQRPVPSQPAAPVAPQAPSPTVPNTGLGAASADKGRRSSFSFGLGLGAGIFDTICDGCDSPSETGFSGFLSLAGGIGEKTFIGVETTGWTKEEDNLSTRVYSVMAHVTEYASTENGLFFRAGLGLVGLSADADLSANAFGFLGRVGYELGSGGLVVAPYVGLVRTFSGAELKQDGDEVGFDFALSNVQVGLSIGNR